MDKGNLHMVRARTRDIIDHPQSGLFQLGDSGLDSLDRKSDVMQALSSLVEKRGHRAGGIGGFQQFEPDITDPEECNSDFLAGNLLDPFEYRSEGAFIILPLG